MLNQDFVECLAERLFTLEDLKKLNRVSDQALATSEYVVFQVLSQINLLKNKWHHSRVLINDVLKKLNSPYP